MKPDAAQLRKRVWLRLLGSPVTVAPFVAGVTAATISWALEWNVGIGAFAGLAGVLGSAGAFVTQLVLRGEKIAHRVLDEQVKDEEQSREGALDALDERLTSSDDDPRPEVALRDLRALLKAFDETVSETSAIGLNPALEIHARVKEMFDHCVHALEQTIKLWQTAQRLQTIQARRPILQQREKIILDIQATIKQLSDTLVALQTFHQGDQPIGGLDRLRTELDRNLETAKMIEARVNSLVNELTDPLPTNPQREG